MFREGVYWIGVIFGWILEVRMVRKRENAITERENAIGCRRRQDLREPLAVGSKMMCQQSSESGTKPTNDRREVKGLC